MAFDLKSLSPDTTFGAGAFLFGADSQAAAAPSVYGVADVAAYLSSLLNGQSTLTGATVTTSQPLLNHTQTWNAGGVTFTGWKLNVTDTASASASLLADLQVAGSSKFSVRKDGTVVAATAFNSSGFVYATSGFTTTSNAATLAFNSDVILSRAGAAILQHGAADAASPVAQTIGVQNVVAGTSNTAGADWTLKLSTGTGTGLGGNLIIQTPLVGTTGTSQNSWTRGFDFIGPQANGSTANTFNIYNTSTSSNANYERGALTWTGNTLFLQTENAGTGGSRGLTVRTTGASALTFGTNNTNRWQVDSSGHFIAFTDNAYDIGASGANRPKDVYISGTYRSTQLITSSHITSGGDVQVASTGSFYWNSKSIIGAPSDGVIKLSNNAQTDFTRLQFGGTSALFPALKRNGGSLEVRAADDSGFASLQCAGIVANGDLVVGSANKMRFGGGGGRVDLTSPADKVLKVADNAGGASIVQLQHFTVAGLPSAATYTGSVALVSDANATTARSTVAGGGSNKVMVMSDGTNWLIVA